MMNTSEEALIKGRGFYRITEPNPSFAQMFALDVSVSGVTVGPLSDFATYEIYYPDPLASSGIGSAIITPDRPWTNPTIADVSSGGGYKPPQGGMPKAKGQILVFVRDFQLNAPQQEQIVDLIAFLGVPPQVLPKRSSKTMVTPVEFSGGGIKRIRVPFFGRKSFEIDLLVDSVYAGTFDLEIRGVRSYLPYDETGGGGGNLTSKLITSQAGITHPGSSSPAFTFQYLVDGQTDKASFDYISFEFANWTVDNDPAANLSMGIQANIEVHD